MALAVIACLATTAAYAQQEPRPIRVGVIGFDTSHVIHFTTALNAAEPAAEFASCRVVAGFPPGSPDIPSSVSRVPDYIRQMQDLDVTVVDSIAELLERVDAVLLETNDGRPHLEQALPVLKSGKPVFVDKPIAASLADAIAIFDAAEHYGAQIFSSSALRFSADTRAVQEGAIGDVLGCDVYGPCPLEPTHPDFSWYGIHGVEALVAVMGPRCLSVARTQTKYQELAVGVWEGGRIGTFRGLRTDGPLPAPLHERVGEDAGKSISAPQHGGIAFGTKGSMPIGSFDGYLPLLSEIVTFFRTGVPPVSREQTLAVMAFIEAADQSKMSGGQPVSVERVMEEARREALKWRSW